MKAIPNGGSNHIVSSSRQTNSRIPIWLLLLGNTILCQVVSFYMYYYPTTMMNININDDNNGGGRPPGLLVMNELDIPTDKAIALPSIRISDNEDKKIDRHIYGGKGDKTHLGGFTDFDIQGVSPATWKWMIEYLGIKSLLDVGCGRGISTSWFIMHGVDTLCVEGSHDAIEKTMIPIDNPVEKGILTEHDFSRGPWWPDRTVDAIWCVEFLEHVGRNYQYNYIKAFRKAALIFVSHSVWGGWHHVEVHDPTFWITKMEGYGFVYSKTLTDRLHSVASQERNDKIISPKSNNETYNAQNIWTNMKVFLNPQVLSLKEHSHLFAEGGCFVKMGGTPQGITTRMCNGQKDGAATIETPLPKEYWPLNITKQMDIDWENLVRKHISS